MEGDDEGFPTGVGSSTGTVVGVSVGVSGESVVEGSKVGPEEGAGWSDEEGALGIRLVEVGSDAIGDGVRTKKVGAGENSGDNVGVIFGS